MGLDFLSRFLWVSSSSRVPVCSPFLPLALTLPCSHLSVCIIFLFIIVRSQHSECIFFKGKCKAHLCTSDVKLRHVGCMAHLCSGRVSPT